SEAVAAPGEAAPDGPDGPSELAGGLVVGQAFEVAEDQGGPVLLGEAAELLVEGGAELGGLGGPVRRRDRPVLAARPFDRPTPRDDPTLPFWRGRRFSRRSARERSAVSKCGEHSADPRRRRLRLADR